MKRKKLKEILILETMWKNFKIQNIENFGDKMCQRLPKSLVKKKIRVLKILKFFKILKTFNILKNQNFLKNSIKTKKKKN